jgi:hypothetical protein
VAVSARVWAGQSGCDLGQVRLDRLRGGRARSARGEQWRGSVGFGVEQPGDGGGESPPGAAFGGQGAATGHGAALVLVFAFAALSTGPETDLKVMATALGTGILLRHHHRPGAARARLVAVFGPWNWWLPTPAGRRVRDTGSTRRHGCGWPA